MTHPHVHRLLEHYAARFQDSGESYYVTEAVYIAEMSLLESHGWVECTRMVPEKDHRGEPIYRVKLTATGRMHAGLPRALS